MDNIPEITKIEKKLFKDDKLNKTLDVFSIFYKSDNIIVQGYVLKKKTLSKKVPVIIYCRGGNNSDKKAMFGEVSLRSQLQRKEFIYLAENEKAIIFYPNYRGSSMSEGTDEFGGRDVNDIISLYPIISQYEYCDNTKIALYGWSRGGIMAIITATKVNWIKTIILGSSPYSLYRHIQRPEMKNMWKHTFHLSKTDLKNRSPKYLINKIPKNIPILIMHGSNDTKVNVAHAYSLGKKCQKNNILYKLIIFPNGDHGLKEYTKEVMDEVIKWIDIFYV